MSASDLADFINRQIRALRLTRTEVAKQAGFSRETLNKLLRAEVAQPTNATIVQLAGALRVAPLYLLRVAYGGSVIPIHTGAKPKYPRDHSSFVRDVSYPDNSIVSANQEFDKVWEIQNTGQQNWEGRILKCMDEEIVTAISDTETVGRLASLMLVPMQTEIPIPGTPPGRTVQLHVLFRAPAYPCTTISRWKMVDADGEVCMPGLTGIWCLVRVMAL